MVKLVLLEQHLDRQPPTVVTQATTWWETVLAHVKTQECGLGVHLPVKVCYQVVLGNVSNLQCLSPLVLSETNHVPLFPYGVTGNTK